MRWEEEYDEKQAKVRRKVGTHATRCAVVVVLARSVVQGTDDHQATARATAGAEATAAASLEHWRSRRRSLTHSRGERDNNQRRSRRRTRHHSHCVARSTATPSPHSRG